MATGHGPGRPSDRRRRVTAALRFAGAHRDRRLPTWSPRRTPSRKPKGLPCFGPALEAGQTRINTTQAAVAEPAAADSPSTSLMRSAIEPQSVLGARASGAAGLMAGRDPTPPAGRGVQQTALRVNVPDAIRYRIVRFKAGDDYRNRIPPPTGPLPAQTRTGRGGPT